MTSVFMGHVDDQRTRHCVSTLSCTLRSYHLFAFNFMYAKIWEITWYAFS